MNISTGAAETFYFVNASRYLQTEPSVTQDLQKLYGLSDLAKRVARVDEWGNKRKMRQSYKGHIQHLPGEKRRDVLKKWLKRARRRRKRDCEGPVYSGADLEARPGAGSGAGLCFGPGAGGSGVFVPARTARTFADAARPVHTAVGPAVGGWMCEAFFQKEKT
ncbi:hypothetical protein PORY_002159 [Pneumocystis oryctolagi]|uniref:Uncharacterized protein n=1 Tax=Pneumocystis oryctolagi TaxID=42067 RepID=A0ACB7C9Q5_9ASCO|nr:hypothetical protein PORY_002159 [Pneumocystis oryctolagi]